MGMSRPAAVAGLFYPDDPTELKRMIDGYLSEAPPRGEAPKALIAPHAGLIYSGPIAAHAYATLASARATIRRVLLLGPAHRVAFHGLAASSLERFDTPLGAVALDRPAIARALSLPQVRIFDEAHRLEHSLEVQLPFLIEVLEQFSLVPLVVGDATPEEVADVLDLLWGGPETLIVVSSDLSHYQSYARAQQLDAATSEAIERLTPNAISFEQACGRTPVRGLLLEAKRLGLHAVTLDLRNSGDTAGPRNQVVGYGAYAFH